MHTDSAPTELELPTIEAPAAPKARKETNHLTLRQTVDLGNWINLPDNLTYVTTETDAASALKATQDLGFDITPGNISGTRRAYEIEKLKPEPPPAPPAASQDTDLIALHQQLKDHGLQCEALRIEARTTREATNLLIQHVRHLQLVILQNATRLEALPEKTMEKFKGVQPLTPLPEIPETAKAA